MQHINHVHVIGRLGHNAHGHGRAKDGPAVEKLGNANPTPCECIFPPARFGRWNLGRRLDELIYNKEVVGSLVILSYSHGEQAAQCSPGSEDCSHTFLRTQGLLLHDRTSSPLVMAINIGSMSGSDSSPSRRNEQDHYKGISIETRYVLKGGVH